MNQILVCIRFCNHRLIFKLKCIHGLNFMYELSYGVLQAQCTLESIYNILGILVTLGLRGRHEGYYCSYMHVQSNVRFEHG